MTRRTGTFERTTVAGESVEAFVPHPLPPRNPPLDLGGSLGPLEARASERVRLLELAGDLVPSVEWFVYGFVRKEAVLSAQIEGAQATLMDRSLHLARKTRQVENSGACPPFMESCAWKVGTVDRPNRNSLIRAQPIERLPARSLRPEAPPIMSQRTRVPRTAPPAPVLLLLILVAACGDDSTAPPSRTGSVADPVVTALGDLKAPGTSNGVIQGSIRLIAAFESIPATAPFQGMAALDWTVGDSDKVRGATAGAWGIEVVPGVEMPSSRSMAASRGDTVPGQWIVRMRQSTQGLVGVGGFSMSAARAEGLALRDGLSGLAPVASGDLEVSAVLPVLGLARVEVSPGAEGEAMVRRLREDPAVEWVAPSIRYHAFPTDDLPGGVTAAFAPPPADARVAALTSAAGIMSERFYPRQSWHYGMIGLPRVWDVTQGSPQVIVAVVDDGIRFDHPAVAANLTLDGYDFVSDWPLPACGGGTMSSSGDGDGWDPDPTIPQRYLWTGDCISGNFPTGGHGLHVAGTIAASNLLVGVAPGVRIRPVRVLGSDGSGSDFDVAFGIAYAAGFPVEVSPGQYLQVPQARIINLSLGGPQPSPILEAVVNAATSAGSLIVASAGNAGTTAPNYPASYPQTLSVAAVGPTLELTAYSNRGNTIDLVAPGGDFQWGGRGGIWSSYWRFTDNAPLLAAVTGTSMAAPHVSGVAALLLSRSPGLGNTQLRDMLLRHAIDLGAPGTDPLYGHGLVHALSAMTAGRGFPSDLRVHLTRDASGEPVASLTAGPGGSFRFAGLAEGDYRVHAGLDDRRNGITGLPGLPWGALGGSASPSRISIRGHGVKDASFTVGFPLEREPNDDAATANELEVGGYSYGMIAPAGDVDVFRVRVPSAGLHTFETHGLHGMCASGAEVDTVMELYTPGGQLLAVNDDIDPFLDLWCSRITRDLEAGEYVVRVRGYPQETGQYGVSVRAGGE